MKKSFLIIICVLISICNLCFSQIAPYQDFETGTALACQCPSGYTCLNDVGRVTDGAQTLYTVGVTGCSGFPYTNYTSSLGAHSGTGYVYFYAGFDRLSTANKNFLGGEQIELCVWYSGPQGAGDLGQNSIASHFSFGMDGVQISPNIFVPTGTVWTQYCYSVNMISGIHNFSIMSGGQAKYVMWFDDLSIVDISCTDAINLGNDTTLCEGNTLQLEATIPNATYLWNDNSTSATNTVNQQGVTGK